MLAMQETPRLICNMQLPEFIASFENLILYQPTPSPVLAFQNQTLSENYHVNYSSFPGIKATRELKPHFLCTYLYELATEFSSFYNQEKVMVDEKDTEIYDSCFVHLPKPPLPPDLVCLVSKLWKKCKSSEGTK